jgi:hypothetical protein
MRKFRFIGDATYCTWEKENPKKGFIYDIGNIRFMTNNFHIEESDVDFWVKKGIWEEVFEKETNSLTIENHIAEIVGYAKSKGMTVEIIFKSIDK